MQGLRTLTGWGAVRGFASLRAGLSQQPENTPHLQEKIMRTSEQALARLARSLGDDIFVVGLSWSDEGKGAVANNLTLGTEASVRWHGGASAGHNILLPGGRTHHLHNLPCGIVRNDHLSLVGPLCVIDPMVIAAEAAIPELHGQIGTKILIDAGTRIVLPVHKLLDAGKEQSCITDAYGTTKTGMGPAHEDLIGRKSLTALDLASGPQVIRQKLLERRNYEEKQAVAAFWGVKVPSLEETVDWCGQYTELFSRLVGDTRQEIQKLRDTGKQILWEGAHGAMIDIVNGSMPTSSLVSPWSAYHCYGPMRNRTAVVGVFRPYVTRTGAGPMPTEMAPDEAAVLHHQAGEIESTTGRKQRCGWLDLMATSYSMRLTGTTHLYITKMDTMPFHPIRVCVGYTVDGRPVSNTETLSPTLLQRVVPEYRNFDGWDGEAVANARHWSELPQPARTFLSFLEDRLRVPVIAVGNGPQQGDVVLKQ